MKRTRFMAGAITLLIAAVICLSVYADKQHKEGKTELPAPVKAAVESLYPGAEIEEVKLEDEGLKLYDIELKQDGKEHELTVAADGTVVEKESGIDVANLPEAIKAALAGAKAEEAKQQVAYWVITLTKLDNPKITYEVGLKQDGKDTEIEFAPDGTVLKKEVKEADDDDEGEQCKGKGEDKDDEKDEQSLSLDQVPAPVKAMITEQAQSGEVKKIEQENDNGTVLYEAEIVIDGKKYDVKISADGKLLGKEAADENGNDNEGDEEDND